MTTTPSSLRPNTALTLSSAIADRLQRERGVSHGVHRLAGATTQPLDVVDSGPAAPGSSSRTLPAGPAAATERPSVLVASQADHARADLLQRLQLELVAAREMVLAVYERRVDAELPRSARELPPVATDQHGWRAPRELPEASTTMPTNDLRAPRALPTASDARGPAVAPTNRDLPGIAVARTPEVARTPRALPDPEAPSDIPRTPRDLPPADEIPRGPRVLTDTARVNTPRGRDLPDADEVYGWDDLRNPDVWDLVAEEERPRWHDREKIASGEIRIDGLTLQEIEDIAKKIDVNELKRQIEDALNPPPPPPPPPPPSRDPLMLDLNGDGRIGTTGSSTARDRASSALGSTVLFDLDGDGDREQIEWSDGRGDGLLVDDRDGSVSAAARGNGEISGRQLFGDQGGQFANGYAKLAQHDTNKDGKISGSELNGLKVWIDDGDARVEEGELRTAAELGITDISVRLRVTPSENGEVLMRSSFTQNGQTRMSEDVWFGMRDSLAPGVAPSPETSEFLRELRGVMRATERNGDPAPVYRSLIGDLDAHIAQVNAETLRVLDRISSDADQATTTSATGRPTRAMRFVTARRV